VAMDNDYATWNAYKNQFWPAEYLIDQNGQIVYKHFGEGNYDHTENAIRKLLGIDQGVAKVEQQRAGSVQSPEMYFKLSRLKYLAPEQSASVQPKQYLLPHKLAVNTFALQGEWQFGYDHAELTRGAGQIRLHFSSGKLFMVAASEKRTKLKIVVDGKPQPDVDVQMSRLYTLFDSNDYHDHTIEIEIPSKGLNAFTFTFG
jgi:thioredoxin family protein